MKIKVFLVLSIQLILLLSNDAAFAQNWNVVSTFPGSSKNRSGPTGTSIGSDIYIGLGYDINANPQELKDFWRYSTLTNTWTRLTDFPGSGRSFAFAFVIGTDIYIGGGNRTLTQTSASDFFVYHTSTGTWNAIPGLPVGLAQGVSFSLNSKGYIACGVKDQYYNSFSTNYFYCYDPAAMVWTPKANVPGSSRRLPIGFSMNGYCFVGGGAETNTTSTTNLNDFWKYDPSMDSWTRKNDINTSLNSAGYFSGGFSISDCAYGYTVGSYDYRNGSTYNSTLKYDPLIDQWLNMAPSPTSPYGGGAGCIIGGFIYSGFGQAQSPGNIYSYNIFGTNIASSQSPICTQSTFTLQNPPPYTSSISWSSSNPSRLSIDATTGIATRLNNYTGNVTITATINGSCGTTLTKTVWLGPPVFNSISIDGNSGPYPLCSSGTNITYTANVDHTMSVDVSGGSSPSFALTTNSGLVSGSMLNSTTYDFISKSTSPNFNITVSSNNGCGTTSQCLYFSNGSSCQSPQITSITINGSPWNSVSCSDGYFTYAANTWYTIQVNNNSGNPITYSANSSGVSTQSVSSNTFKVKCSNSTQSFAVHITASNSCSSAGACIWFSNSGGPEPALSIQHGKSLQVHPNPASTSLTIQLTDSLSTNPSLDQPMQVFLINRYSQTVYSAQSSDKNFQMPVSSLPTDVYYLNVFYGDAILREQIFITR